MHLDTIKLTNFKNYESANLTFSPQLNAFVGLNGTGKTNLLDAIYYACMCKSYFLPLDSDVILRGSDFLRIDAVFQKQGKRERIVAKAQARKRKIFERNDVPYTALSDHIGLLPVVMIAPDDTDLIKEGSEERRRFIDNALSQLDNLYLRHLMFYNKIVEQRNAALKKWGENESKTSGKHDNTEGVEKSNWQQLIDTYDSQLVPSANYIFEKRQAFILDFEPVFNYFYKKITDERETVSIVYESQLLTDNLPNLLHRYREKDRFLQRTSAGIHKDNLSFDMNGKPLRKFGSQGQLKSFVIALKLAQYHVLKIKNTTLTIKDSLNLEPKKEALNLNNALELDIKSEVLTIDASLELDIKSEVLTIDSSLELVIKKEELPTISSLKLEKEPTNIHALTLRNSLDNSSDLIVNEGLNQPIQVNNSALNNELNNYTYLELREELDVFNDLELRSHLEIKHTLTLENTIDLPTESDINTKLTLNYAELIDKPLLLLDDIFDKLDEQRVQNLLQLIVSQQFGQIFITDTHIERVEKLGKDLGIHFKKFEIENGTIKAI